MQARASVVLGFAVGCVATTLVSVSAQAVADPVLSPHKPLADADAVVHAAIANLDRRVSNLEHYKSAVFIGITPALSTGKFQHKTAGAGLVAAAALCSDTYGPGAHMCTAQEIYASAAGGILNPNRAVPKSWIMSAGLADNCSGYTSDRQATGAAFQWDLLPTGHHGPRFLGGTDAACTAMLPIACCY